MYLLTYLLTTHGVTATAHNTVIVRFLFVRQSRVMKVHTIKKTTAPPILVHRDTQPTAGNN